MLRLCFYMTILLALIAGDALGQISPGDLSAAHADLEGIRNCTQCHTLGDKVSNDKCLDCHSEIQSLIAGHSGYHGSKEVRQKDCFACHSEHHGRKFDMIHFEEDGFEHKQTGYDLTGAHVRIDCRDCHQPDNIDDRELKKRSETYLGLQQDCKTCHTDYHQNTLSSNDCARCHVTESFAPARKFDHDDAAFRLLGQHREVDCIQCHKKEVKNGKVFQNFVGIPFGNCNDCHFDVHDSRLGTDCKLCHVEDAFTSHKGLQRFDHNTTDFRLKGKHQSVSCEKCHNLNTSLAQLFQDRVGVKTSQCAACHQDVHDGKFGGQCADCHNERSFRISGAPDNFNHNLTGYALEGKHRQVDCRECHTGRSFLDPLPHNACAECHQDYHRNEFAVRTRKPDCAECHLVDGFSPSQYSLEAHNRSRFPLEGAHVATPCFACHLQDDRWTFRGLGERCVDCHQDPHVGEIDKKFYPLQSCDKCHVTNSWKESNFNHNLTDFALQGQHARTSCGACHVQDEPQPHRVFAGLGADCRSCHQDVHDRQFEKNGVTDCVRCHAFENWKAEKFNHNTASFKLEGKHAEVECAACHKEVVRNGIEIVQYKLESFQCIDCHQ